MSNRNTLHCKFARTRFPGKKRATNGSGPAPTERKLVLGGGPAALCLLAMSTLLAFGNATAWTAERISSDRLLPPDVYVYASIPSVADAKAKWNGSLLGRLRGEEALAEFWRDMDAQAEVLSGQLQKQLGVTLNDLLAVPEGELAFAVVQPEEGKLGFVALLDFGDSRQTVDKLLERTAKIAAAPGSKPKAENIEGTPVNVFQLETADDGSTVVEHIAYFVKGSHLVWSNSIPVLRSILERWDGKHPQTFAKNETYRYIIERCREKDTEPILTWYVDPIGLVNAVNLSYGQGNIQVQLALGFLPTLGLTKLKAIGGTVDMATDDYETIGRALAYVDLPAAGILKALEFPAAEQAPPKWVSSDASIYVGLNWNLAGAYAAVETLFDTFNQPGAFGKMIRSLAEDPTGPRLHLKEDVIDELTGRIHVLIEQHGPEDARKERMLIALAAKNAGRMTDVLASLAKMPGFPGQPREVGGRKLYAMPAPGPLAGGSSTMGALAVIDGHLMIATDVALLEEIIRADKTRRPLAESAEYRKLAKHFPKKTSALTFEKQKRQLRKGYERLRSGDIELKGFDFTKLPPFEIIQKYLPATGGYAVPDERGALFVSFSLRDKKD